MNRINYLDNVKSFLVAFVLLAHAAMPFLPFDAWFIHPSNTHEKIPYCYVLVLLSIAFIINLFSFLSGYFCVESFDRKGGVSFLKSKLIRYGIPLTIGCVIYTIMLGGYNYGHLWYLELLLIFCLIYCLARKFFHSRNFVVKQVYIVIILFFVVCVMGLMTFEVRQIYTYNQWVRSLCVIHLEPAHLPQYFMMFILGVYSYHSNMLSQMSNKIGAIFFVLGVLSVLGLFYYDDNYDRYLNSRLYAVHESFIAVFFNVGLMWLFRQCFDIRNSLSIFLHNQAYGVHLIHVPFLVGFQLLFDPLDVNVYMKFVLSFVLTYLLSLIVIWLFRKIAVIRSIL